MKTYISNEIIICNPSSTITNWCKKNLVFANPEYMKKKRMGKWVGNTPKELILYKEISSSIVVPYGVLLDIYPLIKEGQIISEFVKHENIDFGGEVSLYDYQVVALNEMYNAKGGILQSKAGSGKTQIGLALAQKIMRKTLWITHTHDLLNQSMTRAEQYFSKDLVGTITEGKIKIGQAITFATVQTLANIDLSLYKNYWDCIIIDECHRVAGSPTSVTQFSKVIGQLSARYKYGLSATLHRSDGLIGTTYSLIGQIMYIVPDKAVSDFVMDVSIKKVDTGIKIAKFCLGTDGTLNYNKLITYLCQNEDRNKIITSDLVTNIHSSNLILSERLSHLKILISLLPEEVRKKCVYIDGSMTSKINKLKREKAIEDMRNGTKNYLFATYRLAKEGLDIPRLNKLYLVTPQKDFAVITQCIGRIARTYDDKPTPICYDYVDDIYYLIKKYKERMTTYRKCKCKFL